MFAPLMHPAMRHVGPVRRELAIHTVMNVLGPLANPAGAGRQVVGVADAHRLPLLAGALAELGSTRVDGRPRRAGNGSRFRPWARHASSRYARGRFANGRSIPHHSDLAQAIRASSVAAEPQVNASIIEGILAGGITGGARSAVVLNAAAAIHVSGDDDDFSRSVDRAEDSLTSGAGYRALERLRAASQKK